MKFVYIANARIPTKKAHGLQIMKMCEAFAQTADLILFVPRRINKLKTDPFIFYNFKKNFRIRKIFNIDFLELCPRFKKFSFHLQNLSFSLWVSFKMCLVTADLFFSRDIWSAFFLSLLGKNVVYEIHDSPSKNCISTHALKRINKFVVTNFFKKEELIKNFSVNEHRIFVKPNGVDLNFFKIEKTQEECRRILSLPIDKKIILYAGHLYSWKGVEILRAAAYTMPKDILVVFVGGNVNDVKSFTGTTDPDKGKNVLTLGYQEYKKIPLFLHAADILVLPNTAKENISLLETSPIKLFEYMASGRLIVASDIPSVREIVNENEVLFFEPDNPLDLAEKIIFALNCPERYSSFPINAAQKVQKYTWLQRAEDILKFGCHHKYNV